MSRFNLSDSQDSNGWTAASGLGSKAVGADGPRPEESSRPSQPGCGTRGKLLSATGEGKRARESLLTFKVADPVCFHRGMESGPLTRMLAHGNELAVFTCV